MRLTVHFGLSHPGHGRSGTARQIGSSPSPPPQPRRHPGSPPHPRLPPLGPRLPHSLGRPPDLHPPLVPRRSAPGTALSRPRPRFRRQHQVAVAAPDRASVRLFRPLRPRSGLLRRIPNGQQRSVRGLPGAVHGGGARQLGVERYSVAGISYGGFVAFRMAEMAPDVVERVVILTSGICFTAEQRRERERNGGRDVGRMLIPQRPKDLVALLRWSMYRPPRWIPSFFLRDATLR